MLFSVAEPNAGLKHSEIAWKYAVTGIKFKLKMRQYLQQNFDTQYG